MRSLARRVTAVALVVAIAAPAGAAWATDYISGTPSYRPGADAATSLAPTAEHPFGYPVWLPLRTPAKVGCVMANCSGRVTHGSWAIDFRASEGDPVFAAGAGIAHVGGTGTQCSTSTEDRVEGTWVWIDHGGGIYSRYNHLSSVLVTDGQLVGPSTRIGSVGHTGTVYPCRIDYLHFEVVLNGYKNDSTGTLRPKLDPGPLAACHGRRLVRYPTDWGFTSWDLVPPYFSGNVYWVSSEGASCGQALMTTPSRVAAPTASVTESTATLRWSDPDVAVDRVVLAVEMFHPSASAYGWPTFLRLRPDRRATTLTGLQPGRSYRVRVAYRNEVGPAAWSAPRVVVPMAPPGAPPVRSLESTRSSVRLGWSTPDLHGVRPSGYAVGLRRLLSSGTWGSWVASTPNPDYMSHRWAGLRAATTYQVRVRALSPAGPGPWTVRSVRTLS